MYQQNHTSSLNGIYQSYVFVAIARAPWPVFLKLRDYRVALPFEMFSYSFLAYILGQISNPQMPCLSNHLGPNTSLGIVVCWRAHTHELFHIKYFTCALHIYFTVFLLITTTGS